MKQFFIIIFIVAIAFSCNNNNPKDKEEQKTNPTDTLNNILQAQSEADLIKMFGKANICNDSISFEGGSSINVTLIYPKTEGEVEVHWTDPKNKKEIVFIKLKAPFDYEKGVYNINNKWKTNFGFALGATLKEIEQINGCPFIFYGFGWDNGGLVSEFNGGKLANLPISIYFDVIDTNKGFNDSNYEKLLGDSEFNSSDPEAQHLNPVVVAIDIKNKKNKLL